MSAILNVLHSIDNHLAKVQTTLDAILAALSPDPITGITVTEVPMLTKIKAKYMKSLPKAAAPGKKGDPIAMFTITDDPGKPGNYLVHGTNAAGDVIDISAVATIAVTASDTTIATASTTGPVGFAVQGVKAGSVTVTVVATWTDGSVGPFSGDIAFTVTPGGPTGLVVTPA